MKSMEAKFKDVIIAHDMTKKECQECKALVEEAKLKKNRMRRGLGLSCPGPPGQMTVVKLRKRY